MTDLTEQFLDDEIDESKLYYFKQKMSEEIEVGCPFALNMVRAIDGIYLDWFLIDKVLAPVPSYEEWQKLLSDQLAKNEGEEINAELEHRLAMVKANGKYPDRISRLKSRVVALSEENSNLKSKLQLKETAYDFDTARLEEENAQLKELLKECKAEIEKDIPKQWHGEKDETMQKYSKKRELRAKIDEALQ